MNAEANYLEHIGLVTDSQHDRVRISLLGSGCSACHRSLCMLGDSRAKEVEISTRENMFKSGDEVIVKINPSSGYKAVTLLYLIPFMLMILTLVGISKFGYHESIAGIAALLILIPYYGMIYLLKDYLKGQCSIEVEKR
jgi:positive regulator of sigma E activity